MTSVRKILFSISIVFLSSTLFAEQRQHGTHVHGEGELLVVLEDTTLEMSFRIPGMDLIGFEHAARTKEQEASIHNTKAYLRKGDEVFDLQGSAECELRRSSALFAMTTHDHHEEQGESHSDAMDQHQDDDESEHAEFHVKHKYECGQPEQLESIVFNIFDKYEAIEKVKAVYIVFSEQSSVTLTAEKPAIRLKECRFGIGSWCLQ